MKVLVACEESQRVCTEFRRIGHEAYSCDIQECSGGHPEWHIQGDVLPYINGNCIVTTMDGAAHQINGTWDLLIAHPPCTYLSNAGAWHLWRGHVLNQDRYEKGLEGKAFFMRFLGADCPRICVENPVPSRIYGLPRYTQTIQPYEYGHSYSKRTCLWLVNLPPLQPTNIVEPIGAWCELFTKDRAKNRSKTFLGIAQAMAQQWGVKTEKTPAPAATGNGGMGKK